MFAQVLSRRTRLYYHVERGGSHSREDLEAHQVCSKELKDNVRYLQLAFTQPCPHSDIDYTSHKKVNSAVDLQCG